MILNTRGLAEAMNLNETQYVKAIEKKLAFDPNENDEIIRGAKNAGRNVARAVSLPVANAIDNVTNAKGAGRKILGAVKSVPDAYRMAFRNNKHYQRNLLK